MSDADLVDALRARGATVAIAESLTGGLVIDALVSVPGASDVVRGGVVAYATDLKATLLGVDPAHLAAAGPVNEETARQMAAGVRERLGATWGLATTGVAGPGPSGGHRAGTAHVAVAGPDTARARALVAGGDRAAVRAAATRAVLALLADALGASDPGKKAGGPGVGPTC